MAAYEVLLLNTAIPQIQAAQSGDTYVVPRDIAFNAGVNVVNNDVTIYGVTVGRGAGAVSTNTAVGASALAANTTGATNAAFGTSALAANTSAANNTAVGAYSLLAATTGGSNSALGTGSLERTTTGAYNVAVGVQALTYNTTASQNTAVGYQAGYTNQTGLDNVYLGWKAGFAHTGTESTFLGDYAGFNTTGNNNTFVGRSAGFLITTGTKNIVIGGYNGNQNSLDIRTASNYIVLSDGDGNPRAFNANGNWFLNSTATFIGANNTTSSLASALSQSKNTNITSGSAQTIYSSAVTGNNGSLVIVRGVDASANWFADLVFYHNSNSATVITSAGGGSPGSRTYSVTDNSLKLNPGTTQTTVVCTVLEGSVG